MTCKKNSPDLLEFVQQAGKLINNDILNLKIKFK